MKWKSSREVPHCVALCFNISQCDPVSPSGHLHAQLSAVPSCCSPTGCCQPHTSAWLGGPQPVASYTLWLWCPCCQPLLPNPATCTGHTLYSMPYLPNSGMLLCRGRRPTGTRKLPNGAHGMGAYTMRAYTMRVHIIRGSERCIDCLDVKLSSTCLAFFVCCSHHCPVSWNLMQH